MGRPTSSGTAEDPNFGAGATPSITLMRVTHQTTKTTGPQTHPIPSPSPQNLPKLSPQSGRPGRPWPHRKLRRTRRREAVGLAEIASAAGHGLGPLPRNRPRAKEGPWRAPGGCWPWCLFSGRQAAPPRKQMNQQKQVPSTSSHVEDRGAIHGGFLGARSRHIHSRKPGDPTPPPPL